MKLGPPFHWVNTAPPDGFVTPGRNREFSHAYRLDFLCPIVNSSSCTPKNSASIARRNQHIPAIGAKPSFGTLAPA